MTIDRVKNAKMTTKSVVNFVFFETLTTEKSATRCARPIKIWEEMIRDRLMNFGPSLSSCRTTWRHVTLRQKDDTA